MSWPPVVPFHDCRHAQIEPPPPLLREAAGASVPQRTTSDIAQSLQQALRSLLITQHMASAARIIEPGDDSLLTPAEAAQFGRAVAKVRRASGAARFVARQLCREFGFGQPDILRGPRGEPLWPRGAIGSLSHDAVAAVAIMARTPGLRGIGVDVEDPAPLEDALCGHVLTSRERARLAHSRLDAKAVFSIKEAVFKAVYPVDQVFLDFHQVDLDLARGEATTSYGARVHWRVATTPRVLAVAWC